MKKVTMGSNSKAASAAQHGIRLSDTLTLLDALEARCTDITNAWFSQETTSAAVRSVAHGVLPPNCPAPVLEPVTFFQSSVLPPGLRLRTLALTLLHAGRHESVLLRIASVLVLRWSETAAITPTLHTMHRLLVAGVHLAAKVHSDVFLSTSDAASVSGVSALEMARLERELLRGCDWHVLVVHPEAFDIVELHRRIAALPLPSDVVAPKTKTPTQPQSAALESLVTVTPVGTTTRRASHSTTAAATSVCYAQGQSTSSLPAAGSSTYDDVTVCASSTSTVPSAAKMRTVVECEL